MASVTVEAVKAAQEQIGKDEIFDPTIHKLKLAGALRSGGIDPKGLQVDVTNVIVDGTVEDSTSGAPQLTVQILDRDYRALNSGVFGQKVEVTLDRIPYRLVEVSLTDVERLQLVFEHKLVNVLRQFRSPIKAARAKVTRAQFVEHMLREAVSAFGPIRYVSPEENVTQPVTASRSSGRSLTSKTVGTGIVTKNVRNSGFGLSSLDIQNWDGSTVALGPTQLRNASIVLQVCKQLNAPSKAVLAVMAACIVEPNPKPFDNPAPSASNGGSAGILQWGGGGTTLPVWANDVAQSVAHSLQDPGATGKGGMISLAQRNPSWTPGHIAQEEQGSAFGYRYDQAVSGAQTVINTFTSGGGYQATGTSYGSSAKVGYEFSRGQPGQPEDSWTCIQRLAKEVNWRVFVAGRNAIYFVTDDDLLKAQTAYKITPDTAGFVKLTGDVEVGGRTVKKHRHREPKPSEAQLTVRVDRWGGVPGGVLEVEGWGPYDSRWIIIDTQRPLFDAEATVSLQSPQAPFKEPAATATGGSTLSTTSASGASLSSDTTVSGHPELKPKVSAIVNTLMGRYPSLRITSTVRNEAGSYHQTGEACDLATDPAQMDSIGTWINDNLYSVLSEGIHNPTLSVKYGQHVSAGFWGAATWAQHLNHIHVAVAEAGVSAPP